MSARFETATTPLAGLTVLKRKPLADARGFLERLYCASELQPFLGERPVLQINRTLTSARGTVRGMHFQRAPHAETKVVSCLRGAVLDIAVDVRRGSPTFLQWHAEELTASNLTTLLIPGGFAHGFQTLTDDCELLYFHTAEYAAGSEDGLNPRDPRLAIAWPEPIAVISDRDASHRMLTPDFDGITS